MHRFLTHQLIIHYININFIYNFTLLVLHVYLRLREIPQAHELRRPEIS